MLDFNAPGSSRLNAGFDSGFNARRRRGTLSIFPYAPDDIIQVNGSRKIFYGCVGYPYASVKTCGGLTQYEQQFEAIQITPFGIPTHVEWSVIGGTIPPGLSLSDPDPTDNRISLVGTPTVAGDFTFRLQASGDIADGAQDFLVYIRRPVQWTNIGDWSGISGGDYTSDGILAFSGSYNWLFPTPQTFSWLGNVCPTGAATPGNILIFTPSGSDADLSINIGGSGPLWLKTGTPYTAPGNYDGTGTDPAVATIVEL